MYQKVPPQNVSPWTIKTWCLKFPSLNHPKSICEPSSALFKLAGDISTWWKKNDPAGSPKKIPLPWDTQRARFTFRLHLALGITKIPEFPDEIVRTSTENHGFYEENHGFYVCNCFPWTNPSIHVLLVQVAIWRLYLGISCYCPTINCSFWHSCFNW